MNWEKLKEFAIRINDKNTFGSNKEVSKWIPEEISDLYKHYDPIKVELPFDGSSLSMIPYEKLLTTLKEYGLDESSVVFATCDSDPFFMNKKQVFTFEHGTSKPEWEQLSESIDSFFEKLIADFEDDDCN